jgi:signal transduction histidine kinase
MYAPTDVPAEAAGRRMCCDRNVRLVAPRATGARDAQLAVGAFVGGALFLVLGMYLQIPMPWQPSPSAYLLLPLAVGCVALGLRRAAPVPGLGLGLLAVTVDIGLGGSLAGVLVFAQVLYEACVHGPGWLWRWALRVSIALTLVAAGGAVLVTGSWRAAAAGIPFALVLVLSVVSAISVRQYRDQAAIERARADQTARLAELDRGQAVTAERSRMARELHDVVANHLSAVAIHATALLSVRDMDPEAAHRALWVIRENSVRGLGEMRDMVELLRDPTITETATRARLAEAGRLTDAARDAGLAVDLTIAGAPRPLAVNTDLAAYRILQESLTNALKHGGGRAVVTIGYHTENIELTITNSLTGSATAARATGAGAGLIGMRERVELLGGRLAAAREGDRWRVHAILPATIHDAR